MPSLRALVLLVLLAACPSARAAIVINEVLYHAPDDRPDLQFIELHNTGDKAVDISGWKLTKGAKYTFPARSTIAADGYLVLCKDLKEFSRHYGFAAHGQYTGSLSHKKDQIDLLDAAGKRVDRVKYGSRAPWPLAADGYSSSLERICPTAPADGPQNWAPSPLARGTPKAGGTPGKKNASHAARLAPVIANVTFTPAIPTPDQEVKVEATVRGESARVELRYRVAGPGYEKEEKAVPMKKGDKGRYSAAIPGQKGGQLLRFRIHAVDARGAERYHPHENEVRPAFSCYVSEKVTPGKVPFGFVINVGEAEFRAAKVGKAGGFPFFGRGPTANPPARGKSAFVWVDTKTATPKLFDFVNVTPRSGGRRVRFHKDQPLGDMTTISLVYEYLDRFALAEHLAYDVYRKAGNAACRTDFVRTWIDGRPIGFQLLIEQPNKAFLRRNGLRADGNLYKAQWTGFTLAGRHEKKTNIHAGHRDLIALMERLFEAKGKGDAQWEVIKRQFGVEQFINYFAVNMVLSHWDGYFNNYFVYHDVHGTGRWTIYPWDQDKTWGYHDGIRGYEVFFDMPLTFGMLGDVPPGWPKGRPPPGFGAGPVWWRPGGDFSKPLLANPRFRQHFLARTKDLIENVYTEKVFFPLIKALGERLEAEVKVRAEVYRQDPKQAVAHLHRNLDSLRDHLRRRREFLLAQDELKKAGKFDRSLLK